MTDFWIVEPARFTQNDVDKFGHIRERYTSLGEAELGAQRLARNTGKVFAILYTVGTVTVKEIGNDNKS